jgi:predicted nucleic acid-binding protein
MNGNKLFLDTNILLYLLQGDETLTHSLDNKQFYISFITQLEILSFSNLTKSSEKLINELLSECVIIDINSEIKRGAIESRKNYKLKLPDCLVAATAQYLDLPLITADSDFQKIEELKLIYYER